MAIFASPAQQLKPIFDDVVKDIPDIKVVEIDVEEHPDIASNYKVRVSLVLLQMRMTMYSAMKTGMMTKEQLIQFINES